MFFTNLLSLGCQVLWVRKLAFLFGSTAAVFATVLSTFLLGLAFGALAGGRWADRTARPWRLLSRLLLVLGAWCAISLPLFDLARRLYLAIAPVGLEPAAAASGKALVVLACLIVPTFAIGAVFPLATRLLAEGTRQLGADLSLVYAMDTLGAALGALLAGFILVPHLGLSTATLLLGGAALLLGFRLQIERSPTPTASKAPPADRESSPRLWMVLLAFFLSGAAALLLETGWNRFFYVLNGTSVSSLAIVLAGFLSGLGAGSFLMRRFIGRIADPHLAVAALFGTIGLSGILVLRSAGLFGRLYMGAFQTTSSYNGFQLEVCAVIFAIVFLAAIAMGANFPLVALICAGDSRTRGASIGRVFFSNTLGGVVGAFLGEFVLLPRWSFAGLSLVALALYAVAAAIFLALSTTGLRWRPIVAVAAVLAVAVGCSPLVVPFELPFHALYYHGLRAGTYEHYRQEVDAMHLRWQKDGFYGRVATVEYQGFLLLKHNGKTDASDGGDNYAQTWLAQAPLLLHPNPKAVLNIGLGGGLTLRGVVHHPEVSAITQVEIDPLVVEAARTQFAALNQHALEDPRVRVVIADGRNFVDGSPERYDVIVSEPPNIWVAGVSGLFTQEFYTAAHAHLNAGGILSQWLPIHELEKADFAVALKTLRSVFAHVAVWSNGSDAIVLASDSPIRPVRDPQAPRALSPSTVQDLAAAGLPAASIDDVLGAPQFSEQAVERLAAEVNEINTDNLPLLEFRTAQNLYTFNQPSYRAAAERRRQ
ncbi:MAG: fused MFS/spermidine synthase [Acidobacteriota bacterium]